MTQLADMLGEVRAGRTFRLLGTGPEVTSHDAFRNDWTVSGLVASESVHVLARGECAAYPDGESALVEIAGEAYNVTGDLSGVGITGDGDRTERERWVALVARGTVILPIPEPDFR